MPESFPLQSVAAMLLEIRYPWIDPVALELPGPLDVRWYGLGYLIAFIAGYAILRWLARDGYFQADPDSVGDLVFALMIGTILGGRLGYILFYDFAQFSANPARIIRIWEGGLAFHGGLIGVLLAGAWFARRNNISFLNLGDSLTLAVPIGLFVGRIANFINGELFGRVASPDVPWAMRFPTDPVALRILGADRVGIREREMLIETAYRTGYWDAIRDQVPLRHPSQLYQAATEGLLLLAILWLVFLIARRRKVALPHGMLGGVFLLLYGIFRSITELYREPDAQFRGPGDAVGTVLGPLTMGQLLSIGMIFGGLYLLWRSYAAVRARRPSPR